jgi:prolyl-tRNA synthetase
MSHEFVILADTGESEVACHKGFLDLSVGKNIDYDSDLSSLVSTYTDNYAATDEERDPGKEAALGDDLLVARGIEVGHIFNFGTKYSEPMGAKVSGKESEQINLEMGSYGIGVSRLVGGIIEASHDENGIIWPESVAPFKAGIINLKVGDEGCDGACEDVFTKLRDGGCDVLYDDRDGRAGVKFAEMDLIGLPWQIVIGPRGVKNGVVEMKNRATGEREEIFAESALSKLLG